MFSCLTEIFLSTASAERCKINLRRARVKTVWLPENRLSCKRFHLALPVLLRKKETGQSWGFWFGHTLLFVFQPLGGSAGVQGAEAVWSRAASVKTGLIPYLVLGCSTTNVAPSECQHVAVSAEKKLNQRIECYLKGICWEYFHHSCSLLPLAPTYQLAVKREQIGAFGNQGVPSVHGWQAGGLTGLVNLLSHSFRHRWYLDLVFTRWRRVIYLKLLGRSLSQLSVKGCFWCWRISEIRKWEPFRAEAGEDL